MAKQDPRQVGGRYFSSYWRQEYTVTAMELRNDVIWFTVFWERDQHSTTHCTGWDHKRDQVLS